MVKHGFGYHDLVDSNKEMWRDYTAGSEGYIDTIKRRDIWDNLDKVTTRDAEQVILKFLNNWLCRIPYKHPKEVRKALQKSSKYVYLLKKERLEDVNFHKKIKVGDEKLEIRDIIEKSFKPLDEVNRVGSTAISKIMHMINPNLFVMNDAEIREKYGYADNAEGYINFLMRMQILLNEVLDEYCRRHRVNQKTAKKGILREAHKHETITTLIDNFNWLKVKERH